MKIIPIIILSLSLSGCVIFDFFKKHPEPTLPPTRVAQVDKSLLEYCPLLKEKPVINTFQDVITEYSELSILYGTCASKQATGVKVIKELGNIP